jgi:pimeloyl-ACP methyl ester carboxylesterase
MNSKILRCESRATRTRCPTDQAVRLYQSLVPGSRLTVIENAAHLTMQDEPERYLQVLREFLHEIERG